MPTYANLAAAARPGSGAPREVSARRPRAARRHERRLAAALRKHDPDALAAIQAEYGAIVLGYLRGVLRDRASAEDVLQITLLEVWQRGATYDPARSSLLTWVMMIARSRVIDHMRRRVPEPRDPTAAATLIERDGPDGADQADALLEQWRMAQLLTRLPVEQAEILRMRFYGGLSQREIATRTGLPLGTVKMRMVQALERLRELLDAEGAIA
jgi:RNA polymerase sigma-70 factor, ECF subfamily